jgi:predicted Zn-dependent protease
MSALHRTTLARTGAAFLAALLLAHGAGAQRPKKSAPEFVRQGLLIVNFTPGPGADMRIGRRAADGVRSRVARLVDKREVDVIDGDDIRSKLELSGFSPDSTYSLADIRALGKYLRVDEYVDAYVAAGPGGPRLGGQIVLMRDQALRQLLPEVSAPKLDSAAALFAKAIAAARAQFVEQRHCENALRDGQTDRALAAARSGIATYRAATVTRTCLVWALRQSRAPAAEVLAASREVLALDSVNVHALEGAGTALDSLHRGQEAADMWLRLAAADTANLDLALRVAYSLVAGGNSRRAEPFILALVKAHPDDIRLVEQKWRITYETKNWSQAVSAGEVLLARDSLAQHDSAFFVKLGTAYHGANRPAKAIEVLAHGVSAFPGDGRLFLLYAQYIKMESDSVIPRGLARFPRNAALLALNARDLRSRGKIGESLDATKQALALDSTMAQGQLTVAQLELELGRPDSALVALRRAIAGGEDSSLVSQFALSKGNAMYRAASDTKTSADFSLAARFLAYADSVHSTPQSKFLVGASALGVAQAALTEATKLTDKVESCRLARLAGDMVPVARAGLPAGQELYADAAKQSLDYLDQLTPYVAQETAAYCAATPAAPPPPLPRVSPHGSASAASRRGG